MSRLDGADRAELIYQQVNLPIGLFQEATLTTPDDPLSVTFAALADPTRRAILARLMRGEANVTELARPFPISLPAVTKHLKVLERAGLISRSREAQWRPCKLEAGPLREVADWTAHYRQFWEGSFDRLDDYLETLQAQPGHPGEDT